MPHDILTGDSPGRLLLRWKTVLRFRIGESDCCGLAQLPNVEYFPNEFPTDDLTAGHCLGEVLGVAALKLFRPLPVAAGEVVDLDPMGGFLEDLSKSDYTMDRARLWVVGRVVEMALLAPGRLPELISRLDAIGNDDLHDMAMDAVQGRAAVADVFDWLME